MIYKLAQPQMIGLFGKQISVSEYQLVSLAFTFDPLHADKGEAHFAARLKNPETQHEATVVYHYDKSALEFWQQLDSNHGIIRQVFDKLVADGKLPAGEIIE
jgi:hypothetical protein